jgi:hypothetical protein
MSMRVCVVVVVCTVAVLALDTGPVNRFLGEHSSETKSELLARRAAMMRNAFDEVRGRYAIIPSDFAAAKVELIASPPAIHAGDTVNIAW